MRIPMRKLKKALFAAVALALMSSPAWTVVSQSTQGGSMRDPFVLELPDIGGASITAPEAVIPTPDIHTIRLLVKRPFSDSINYGKIHTFINGESAGTIQNTRSGRDGYI